MLKHQFIALACLLLFGCATGNTGIHYTPENLETFGGLWGMKQEIMDERESWQIGFASDGSTSGVGDYFDQMNTGCKSPLRWNGTDITNIIEVTCVGRRFQFELPWGNQLRITDMSDNSRKQPQYWARRKVRLADYDQMVKIDGYFFLNTEQPACYDAKSEAGRDIRASSVAKDHPDCTLSKPKDEFDVYVVECNHEPFFYVGNETLCKQMAEQSDMEMRRLNQQIAKIWSGNWKIRNYEPGPMSLRKSGKRLEAKVPIAPGKWAVYPLSYDAVTNYFRGVRHEKFNGDPIENHIALRFLDPDILVFATNTVLSGRSTEFDTTPYRLDRRAKRIK